MNEPLRYHIPPEQGPRVVAIGGGTGLSTLLRGLKLYTRHITAVVAVTDDGGGSGELRRELGMLPPGDIRSCMEALANCEPMMSQLMHYRFTEGALAGQSFGNLFLAALDGIMPTFEDAVESLSEVLAITGRVLPVTNANVQLKALLEDGSSVIGESEIGPFKRSRGCRIASVDLVPGRPRALPAVISAIEEADMILLAPGSLYTSVIPNLLVDGVVDAIRRSGALKLYVCNIMTQPGETEGYTVADHLHALFKHTEADLFHLCLVNSAPIPPIIAQRYAGSGSEVTFCDQTACEALGVEILERAVATVENGHVRHNPGHLARELMELHTRRNIRVVGGDPGGPTRNRVEE